MWRWFKRHLWHFIIEQRSPDYFAGTGLEPMKSFSSGCVLFSRTQRIASSEWVSTRILVWRSVKLFTPLIYPAIMQIYFIQKCSTLLFTYISNWTEPFQWRRDDQWVCCCPSPHKWHWLLVIGKQNSYLISLNLSS